MNRKVSLGVCISLVAIVAAITFILTYGFSMDVFNSKVNVKERPAMTKKLEAVDNAVRSSYLGTLDEENLVDGIARGYILGVGDNYASYYSVQQYQTLKMNEGGQSIGIGISIGQDPSGYIAVRTVRAGGPAEEAGVKAGDVIIAVEGKDVLGAGYTASVSAIGAGDEGSVVRLTIRREGQDTTYQMARRRMDNITVTSQNMGGGLGYIKITGFDSKTSEQFSKELSNLRGAAETVAEGTSGGEKLTGIVIDLRNNTGGVVAAVEGIMSQLVPAGELVTATYQDGIAKPIVTSMGAGLLEESVVVLVNSRTSSSAEMLACCLRDFASAKLVGTTTYGKGVMQSTKELADGSAIKITTARYQTTKTPCFDGVGLKPNAEVSLLKDDEDTLRTLGVEEDLQLKKALELLTSPGA